MSFADAKVPVELEDPLSLVPYGWAPGGYYCGSCSDCKEPHMDCDKRSWRCQECALERKRKAELPLTGS